MMCITARELLGSLARLAGELEALVPTPGVALRAFGI